MKGLSRSRTLHQAAEAEYSEKLPTLLSAHVTVDIKT